MTTKQNRPKTVEVDKGTELPGKFIKLWKAEGIKNYSTMNETKAAIAERKVRFWEISFTVFWNTSETVHS